MKKLEIVQNLTTRRLLSINSRVGQRKLLRVVRQLGCDCDDMLCSQHWCLIWRSSPSSVSETLAAPKEDRVKMGRKALRRGYGFLNIFLFLRKFFPNSFIRKQATLARSSCCTPTHHQTPVWLAPFSPQRQGT